MYYYSHFPGEEGQELAQGLTVTQLESQKGTYPNQSSLPPDYASLLLVPRQRERPAPLPCLCMGLLEAQTPPRSLPRPYSPCLGLPLSGEREEMLPWRAEPRVSPGVEGVRCCP